MGISVDSQQSADEIQMSGNGRLRKRLWSAALPTVTWCESDPKQRPFSSFCFSDMSLSKLSCKTHAKKVLEVLSKTSTALSTPNNGHVLYLSGEELQQRPYTDRDLPFRQESNFYYLTGCSIPSAKLVLNGTPASFKSTLFIPPLHPDEVMCVYLHLAVFREHCSLKNCLGIGGWVFRRHRRKFSSHMMSMKSRPPTSSTHISSSSFLLKHHLCSLCLRSSWMATRPSVMTH